MYSHTLEGRDVETAVRVIITPRDTDLGQAHRAIDEAQRMVPELGELAVFSHRSNERFICKDSGTVPEFHNIRMLKRIQVLCQ